MTQHAPSAAAIEWLERLVAHRTVSGVRSNRDLIDEVAGFLAPLGFEIHRSWSVDGARCSLLATRGGRHGGVLLSGHTDVVPVDGQRWTRPTFEVTQDEDRLFGRGVCDMKGFLACMLAVVDALPPESRREPLHLAFTHDEEIGCIGVRGLIDELSSLDLQPDVCIVGEPTSMEVVRAHKGRHALCCRVRGEAAHSSLSGVGVNAVEVAASLVEAVSRQAATLRERDRDDDFYVPYSSLSTCRFTGGSATNVIPAEAEFDFDLRFLPSHLPEDLLAPLRASAERAQAAMRRKLADAEVEISTRTAVPALRPDPLPSRVRARLAGAGLADGRHVAFTSEAGLYQRSGLTTVVCGPGDIAQAHTADEFILKSQMHLCERSLMTLLTST